MWFVYTCVHVFIKKKKANGKENKFEDLGGVTFLTVKSDTEIQRVPMF